MAFAMAAMVFGVVAEISATPPALGTLDDDGVLYSTAGPIRGIAYGNAYTAYLRLPFAEPPIGLLRWAPPVPLKKPWNTTLNAFFPAVSCTASTLGTEVSCVHIIVFLRVFFPSPSSPLFLTPYLYVFHAILGWIRTRERGLLILKCVDPRWQQQKHSPEASYSLCAWRWLRVWYIRYFLKLFLSTSSASASFFFSFPFISLLMLTCGFGGAALHCALDYIKAVPPATCMRGASLALASLRCLLLSSPSS